MSDKKRAIPRAPAQGDDRRQFDQAVKENLEILMGQRAGRIERIKQDATLAEVIAKVNEIITRLQ